MFLNAKENEEASFYKCLFNGEEKELVYQGSEEEGWIDVIETQPEKMRIIFVNGEPKTVRLYGKVQFVKVIYGQN